MGWIKIKDKLPPLSYIESDNEDDPYESNPILIHCPYPQDCFCVAYLVKNQDKEDWNFGDLSFEAYLPTMGGGCIQEIYLETASHWMPLPKIPEMI